MSSPLSNPFLTPNISVAGQCVPELRVPWSPVRPPRIFVALRGLSSREAATGTEISEALVAPRTHGCDRAASRPGRGGGGHSPRPKRSPDAAPLASRGLRMESSRSAWPSACRGWPDAGDPPITSPTPHPHPHPQAERSPSASRRIHPSAPKSGSGKAAVLRLENRVEGKRTAAWRAIP